jgi:uncharacterized phage protein (TIGR02218 family)
MKTLTASQASDVASETLQWADVIHVTLKDGTELAFTSLDEDINVDGVTYVASGAPQGTDVSGAATLEVDNLELSGIMASPAILEDDLRAGKWDNARLLIGKVNALAPAHGIFEQRRGWLGEVTLDGGRWKADFRGLKAAYKIGIVELTSPTCRAVFGDARCGKDASSYAVTGSVGSIDSDDVTIHDAARTEAPHPSGTAYWIGGKLTWTSGANDGLSMEIREATASVLQLGQPMPYAVSAGDTL